MFSVSLRQPSKPTNILPDFRTLVPLPTDFPALGYQDNVLAVGSCFAAEIGDRLVAAKIPTLLNPSGILYHPLAIATLLGRLAKGDRYEEEALFLHRDLWHSDEHHGAFSRVDRQAALNGMNRSFDAAREKLEKATHLLLTFGTAHVYRRRSNGTAVANCHQLPADTFTKERLMANEIVAAMAHALQGAFLGRPHLSVILTVSPVRHLRDGLVANQRSKATLLLAAEQLCQMMLNTHYFPAYEIVMDELRGYRFYAEDMAHPSKVATDYVWERFKTAACTEETQQTMHRVEQLRRAANHRPLHPDTPSHQAFVQQQLSAIENMKTTHPEMNWQTEITQLKNSLQ